MAITASEELTANGSEFIKLRLELVSIAYCIKITYIYSEIYIQQYTTAIVNIKMII